MGAVTFITSFRKLAIDEPITGYIELVPGINISNDPSVKELLLTSELVEAVGIVEAEFLSSQTNIVFGDYDTEDLKGRPPGLWLQLILLWVGALLKNAWLMKDHAMECDAAFLRCDNEGEVSWSKNHLAMRPTFSTGEANASVHLSKNDLLEWARVHHVVEMYLHTKESPSALRFMMENGFARSGRAIQFVTTARTAPDLAFKIATYCSAFETLFATETTELAHKLSERVAFFLGTRGFNKRTVFGVMKSAYAVRSKLVHGDTLKASQIADLPTLSAQCDGYLRIILYELFHSTQLQGIFDSHNQAIDDHFAALILGPLTPTE
jgi:hypothetical protein